MPSQTTTQSQTFADTATDWTSTADFQQFNPALGSLQAIGLGLTAGVLGSISIENLEPVAVTTTHLLSADV